MNEKCPICSFTTYNHTLKKDLTYKICCYKCGNYGMENNAHDGFKSIIKTEKQRNHLSSWVSENQNCILSLRDLERLSKLETPSVEEKAEKLLLALVKKYPNPGDNIANIDTKIKLIYTHREKDNLTEATNLNKEMLEYALSVFSKSWCSSREELIYLLVEYLWKYKKVFVGPLPQKITPEGWKFINSLKNRNTESSIAFLALKFSRELMEFSEDFVETGIKDAGYKPIRIDKFEHNNLIDDEIIANIKNSRFIVADFTLNNNGVYYEAGFARGFNIPVISICDKEYFEDPKNQVHFDTNHYSFILYDRNNGTDLRKKIKYRIESTIGKGNYSPAVEDHSSTE